jgi:predicted XRE-type DNA-binding protein
MSMSKASKKDGVAKRGSGNIFADLGYTDAQTHLLKASLVSRIHDVMLEQKLTQSQAAARMDISQPDISRLLRGQFRDVSVERLMRMLTKLGYEVDIVVREPGRRAKAKNTIHLPSLS